MVGTVNGRIGGTKMSSRRRKNLLRRGCDTAPFSRRRDWRCTAYELSERALSNCSLLRAHLGRATRRLSEAAVRDIL